MNLSNTDLYLCSKISIHAYINILVSDIYMNHQLVTAGFLSQWILCVYLRVQI